MTVTNVIESTSCVWDQNAEAVSVRGTVVGGADDAIGQLLRSFRTFLLNVADQELNIELRGKCGASDVVQEPFREAYRDRKSFRGRKQGRS